MNNNSNDPWGNTPDPWANVPAGNDNWHNNQHNSNSQNSGGNWNNNQNQNNGGGNWSNNSLSHNDSGDKNSQSNFNNNENVNNNWQGQPANWNNNTAPTGNKGSLKTALGLGIAAVVIEGIAVGFILFLPLISLILGIVGLVLCGVGHGLIRRNRDASRPLATAAKIICTISTITTAIIVAVSAIWFPILCASGCYINVNF